MRKRLTTEEFIERSIAVHGNRYDYSKVKYIDSHTKVCIICKKHGEFWITPNGHLNNSGCSKCSNELNANKLSIGFDEFVRRAKLIYGDKYDYSKVKYVNSYTKVCIICPIHGEFWQLPVNHINGKHGCLQCSKNHKTTTKEFIEKAKAIHSDRYDYSKVKYVNSSTKVCIICKIHGEFWQRPNDHLHAKGCLLCGQQLGQRYTKEEFIKRVKLVHGDRYDYGKTMYTGAYDYVTVTCPKHGDFRILAHDLLRKRGCHKCNYSRGEVEVDGILTRNNIKFQTQKTFIGCRDKALLRFDFYLPDYNLVIEFDGRQHYEPISIFGSDAGFKKTHKRDLIKNNYCHYNDIVLLRIKYNENIFDKINEFIELKEI